MAERTPDEQRLRPHPEGRFAPAQIEIDLPAVIARLRAEPRAGEGGHRQQTLYHQGGSTIALFLFERFTHMAEHKANGVVSMHVLRGCLKITAADQVHELRGGQMLVLAPGVPHAIAAEEESEMLLNVHLVFPSPATLASGGV